MKFTKEIKEEYKDIISLRSALAELTLSAAQITRINTLVTNYCEHATQFKIAINATQIIIDPSKPVSSEQLQNVFTVFDYVCYLDICLSEHNTDKKFFLRAINPEFRNNPLIKRDLALKIQSHLHHKVHTDLKAIQQAMEGERAGNGQASTTGEAGDASCRRVIVGDSAVVRQGLADAGPVAAKDSVASSESVLAMDGQNVSRDKATPGMPVPPDLQKSLDLFTKCILKLQTLTFDPVSIDDFITNALIKLMLISFTINLVDLKIAETTVFLAMLEHAKAELSQLLTEISTRLLPSASTRSIFHTCFNNHYYGLGITEYEQLRAKAIEVSNDFDELIKEHAPVSGNEESAPIAESDGGGVDDSPMIVPQPAPVEAPVPRPRTPVDKINTTANPLLEHSPIPFPSPGLSDVSDVPTPLYCVGGGAGVQWTPPRHGTDTSHLNISTPNTGCSSRHPLLYSPADSAGLSLLSTPGTGDRSIIGSSSMASPADAFGAVRKLHYSKQSREPVPPLDLDATVDEVNPADLSGVVDPRDSSGLADTTDVPATIPGHSASDAADLRTNTNGRRL